jgi:superfamily I DNA/RNA helicase
MINPTQEQQKIIEAVASGRTIKVAALAGTGKTSTCKTMHGLAYPTTGIMFNDQLKLKINYDEVINHLEISRLIARVDMGLNEILHVELTPSRILSICRSIVRHFQYQADEEINIKNSLSLIEYEIKKFYPELSFSSHNKDEKREKINNFYQNLSYTLLNYSRDLWRLQKSPSSKIVPADHDTYLKLYQLKKPIIDQYDYIMLDESQDANGCLLDIILNQNCQIIYVGDEYQQIYGYRGTTNAMKSVEGSTLYLTQSFRFGKAIANKANEILHELKSDVNLKGLSSITSKIEDINKPPYTYLARTNSTLFDRYIDAVSSGLKCSLATNVEDTVRLLTAMYFLWNDKKSEVRDDSVSVFKKWEDLVAFADNEKDQDLLNGIKFIDTHQSKTLDMINIIRQSSKIKEDQADIIFTTAHKAKGREWNQVKLADDFNYSKSDSEKNLYYVALTRAKISLDCSNSQRTNEGMR